MRVSRAALTVAVVGVLAGGVWLAAQKPGGSALTGADIAEIERLYYRYSQGLDFAEEETYLSAWADDAVFTQGDGSVVKGKEELRKRWRQRLGGEGTTTLHLTTNILVTPTDDGGAKGRGYWVLLDTSQTPPRPVMSGHYFDTFVRTAQGWRIKTRGSVRGWDWRLKKP
jgi:ketosteroid isomerase-like protein